MKSSTRRVADMITSFRGLNMCVCGVFVFAFACQFGDMIETCEISVCMYKATQKHTGGARGSWPSLLLPMRRISLVLPLLSGCEAARHERVNPGERPCLGSVREPHRGAGQNSDAATGQRRFPEMDIMGLEARIIA